MKENNDTELSLQTASNNFVRNDMEMDEAVNEYIKSVFLNEVQKLDFRQSAESARAINDWVEEQTKNKISDMVSPQILSVDTTTVLVNAIYFQGKWLSAFSKEKTNNQTFYVSETRSVQANMMQQINNFHVNSVPQIKAKVIRLPYEGDWISMHIFLPDDKFGLSEMEKSLQDIDMDQLKKLLQNEQYMETKLKMPKFKIDSDIRLAEILIKMGLTTMFNYHQSQLFPNTRIMVDDVIQKATIEVDEEGTEAAAATALIQMRWAPLESPEPFSFIADLPFLYMLS